MNNMDALLIICMYFFKCYLNANNMELQITALLTAVQQDVGLKLQHFGN